MTTANGVLPPTDQLVAYFSFKVASSTGVPGPDPTVTITASSGTDPLSGTGLSIDEVFGTSFGSSAAMVLASSSPNPTDITSLTPAGAFAALSSYAVDAVIGFSDSDDFFEIGSFVDLNDSGEVDFSEIPAPSIGGTFLAAESGGFTVLDLAFPTVLQPVSSLHVDGSTITQHDVALSGTLFGPRSFSPAGYDFTDSTALTINAKVPEPGSLALFGAGLTFLGGAVYRRRKATRANRA
ncbi:MAG: PEP-CTERM sorting domain-containing protein [Sphingomonadales bacterium]|nr:PEP-CTERM sorting domain-containing protein [Sphingomonadales bacterium]